VRARFLALSAAGDRLAVAAWDRNQPDRCDLLVWDVDRQAVLVRQALDGEACTALALSPDGRRVAVGTRPPTVEAVGPLRVRVWDVDANRQAASRDPGGGRDVTALAFNGDGSRLAVAVGDLIDRAADTGEPRRVQIWDARTWAQVRWFDCRETYDSLAFAPDGRRLAGGNNELLTLWDPAAGEEMLTLRGRSRAGSELPFNPRVVFDPSGARLAAVQNDFSVYIWTAAGYGRK
jgi:WD40 repeat protein